MNQHNRNLSNNVDKSSNLLPSPSNNIRQQPQNRIKLLYSFQESYLQDRRSANVPEVDTQIQLLKQKIGQLELLLDLQRRSHSFLLSLMNPSSIRQLTNDKQQRNKKYEEVQNMACQYLESSQNYVQRLRNLSQQLESQY